MFGGGKVIENYEARKQAAEEAAAAEQLAAEKSKYALAGSRFENEKLKEAFEDTTVSASSFGAMMQEATSQKIQDSFGNISLSMQEIQDAARQIVFGGDDTKLTQYASAAADATSSFQSMQSAVSSMDKLNWKAGMGMVNDEQSVAQYQAGIHAMISSAQQYVEDQHYQATAAIELLVEPGNTVDMTTGLNTFYADIQNQLNSTGEQLTAKMNVALEDGVITIDEQAELSSLQSKIAEITNIISESETEAKMEAIRIKYSGAELDAGSFNSMMVELATQAQEGADTYLDAFEITKKNCNLQLKGAKAKLDAGNITLDEYNGIEASVQAQIDAQQQGYEIHLSKLAVQAQSFGVETLVDQLGSDLDTILPKMEGSVQEKINSVIQKATAAGVDVTSWDVGTASKWLNLEGFTGEAQNYVVSAISAIAAATPEQMREGFATGNWEGVFGTVSEKAAEQAEKSDSYEKVFGGGKEIDPTVMSESLTNVATSAVEAADFSTVGSTFIDKVGEGMSSVDFSESGGGFAEGLQTSFVAAIETVDLSGAAEALQAKLGEALASMEFSDSGGLSDGIQNSLTSSLEGLDYSGVTAAIGTGVGSAIEASMGTIQGAIDSLYSQVGAAINSAFAAGFTTTTTVTITVNYRLANPTATISFSGGGTGTATVAASIHAEGGFVNGPELSWVGEDGPEAIIPLGAKRRQRGVDLWRQAGHLLGIEGYANGGIIGMPEDAGFADSEYFTGQKEEPSFEESVQSRVADTKGGISVQVHLSPSFEIGGQEEGGIVQKIKENLAEIADTIGAQIGVKLAEAYENTPV